jgi:hypothetical protein
MNNRIERLEGCRVEYVGTPGNLEGRILLTTNKPPDDVSGGFKFRNQC